MRSPWLQPLLGLAELSGSSVCVAVDSFAPLTGLEVQSTHVVGSVLVVERSTDEHYRMLYEEAKERREDVRELGVSTAARIVQRAIEELERPEIC